MSDAITSGRAPGVTDQDTMSFVCLINADRMGTFFCGIDPAGQSLYIDGIPFTAVCLFSDEHTGSVASLFAGSPDILVPCATALKMNNEGLVTSFTVYMAALCSIER